jgi:hypothetical protein
MARVEVLSTVKSGDAVYRAGDFVDMDDQQMAQLPPGTVRVMANETEEAARKDSLSRGGGSYTADRLINRVYTPPAFVPDVPWAPRSDSPVDVHDPETGRPHADTHEGARTAREKSIIERQAMSDLRHPDVRGIEPGSEPELGTPDDALPDHLKDKAKFAAPPPVDPLIASGPALGKIVPIVPTAAGQLPVEDVMAGAQAGRAPTPQSTQATQQAREASGAGKKGPQGGARSSSGPDTNKPPEGQQGGQ